MWKLVRDKIQAMSRKAGDDREFAVVTGQNHIKCLRAKLIEEAQEVADSQDRTNLIEELADVNEVLEQLLIEESIAWKEIKAVQYNKSSHKGGFSKGIIMKLEP